MVALRRHMKEILGLGDVDVRVVQPKRNALIAIDKPFPKFGSVELAVQARAFPFTDRKQKRILPACEVDRDFPEMMIK